MTFYKKIGQVAGVAGLKIAAKKISDKAEYILNKTSLMPWGADELNENED